MSLLTREEAAVLEKRWLSTSQYPLRYGPIQHEGRQIRLWMKWPEGFNGYLQASGCYINRSPLTFQDINGRFFAISSLTNIQQELQDQVSQLGLVNEFISPWSSNSRYRKFTIMHDEMYFSGATGPGVIVIDVIGRYTACPWPMSQIVQGLYMRDYDINTLTHVFVTYVINEETRGFIIRKLYTPQNRLTWPQDDPQEWEYGTDEFDALLGTRCGKLISYIVLGAYPRGTRTVSRVVTWPAGIGAVNLRFDIQTFPPNHNSPNFNPQIATATGATFPGSATGSATGSGTGSATGSATAPR